MRIEFTPDPALYPFESRWFDSPKGRIHYIDEGSGPPVMFFHGNPTWSFLYRGVISELRDRFRCIAVDYLGFGLSDRPTDFGYTIQEHVDTIGELFDHLGLTDLVIMGQDWGGPVSLGIATQRADRIRGVVLGNTWFWPADALPMRLFSQIMSTGPMQRRILERNFFVDRLMPIAMATKLSDTEFRHYRDLQPSPEARRGVAEMPKQIRAARPLLERLARDVPEQLGSKPALLVWGMKDLGFRPAVLHRVKSVFSDVEVRELPNAKHYIQEDAPVEIAEAIAMRFG
jgi:haloalkane dehalogenase